MAWEITIQMSKFSTSDHWCFQFSEQGEDKWCYSVICAIPTLPPPMIPMPISSYFYALELEIPISPSRIKFSISCTLLSVALQPTRRCNLGFSITSLVARLAAHSGEVWKHVPKGIKVCQIVHRAQRECFCSRTNVLWGCALLLTGNQSEMVRLYKKHTRNRNQDLFTEKTEQLS